MEQITIQSIWQAYERISPYILETPIVCDELLATRSNASSIHLKLENLQTTGSFKLRGATNKLLSLTEEEKKRGVTTYSTGNHGLAVAYMAKKFNIPATICISNRVPKAKVSRLEQLGAKIEKVGLNQDDAEARAYELEEEEGLTVVPPFDDRHIITGQGTIGIEVMKHVPDIDVVIVPVSGGGIFSGISYVMKKMNPHVKMIGVSMEKSAVMYESIQAQKIVTLEEEDTYADSLLGGLGKRNRYTFDMVQQYIDEFVLLTEGEIAQAIAYIFDQHKIAVEGASATTVATLLSDKINVKNKRVVSLITGRNVDASVVMEVMEKYSK
ncbi:MAG TPA: threonine/serine dehydratase [Pseudogracilibacillus sp.]|nr:threonine/serine dehydratase [Pseudogracilibacillus sp.]